VIRLPELDAVARAAQRHQQQVRPQPCVRYEMDFLPQDRGGLVRGLRPHRRGQDPGRQSGGEKPEVASTHHGGALRLATGAAPPTGKAAASCYTWLAIATRSASEPRLPQVSATLTVRR
jgi:hypothetical protein